MILVTRNPEFNRNFWTEFSGQRAVLVPVLLALLLWLLLSVADMQSSIGPVVEATMLGIAGLALCLGGPYQISQGLYVEWERHTWDIQRLSPITPWTLVWGKLFGSTVFAWYIALCALLVYLVLPGWCVEHTPLADRLLLAGLVVSVALMLQAATFLSTLYSLRFGAIYARYVKRPTLFLAFFALLGVGPVMRLLAESHDIHWYNGNYAPRMFFFGCSIVLALWAFYGSYRLTRSDFLYRNGPLPWLLFSVFLPLLIAGMTPDTVAYSVLLVSLIMLYITLFSAPVDTLAWHHALAFARNGQWRRVGETLPLWTNGAPVVVVMLLYAIAAVPENSIGKILDPAFYMSITGFVLRDIFLFHLLHFSQRNQRAAAACMVYLGVLYALIPGIIKSLEVSDVLGFFLPMPGQSPWMVWVEVLALGIWAKSRWQKYAAVAFAAPG